MRHRPVGEGATSVKDFRRPNVNGSDVEDTEAPVITRGVAASRVAPATSSLVSVAEAAYDAHAPQLKAFAVAAVRDNDAADDLVQETFVRFVRYVRSETVPDNVPGWLHRVCANLIASRGRHEHVAGRKNALLVDTTAAESPEDHVIRMDEGTRLRDALAQLPADARVALLMAAAGFSSVEIGKAIGRTPNATSTYICRARIQLREILSPSMDAER